MDLEALWMFWFSKGFVISYLYNSCEYVSLADSLLYIENDSLKEYPFTLQYLTGSEPARSARSDLEPSAGPLHFLA